MGRRGGRDCGMSHRSSSRAHHGIRHRGVDRACGIYHRSERRSCGMSHRSGWGCGISHAHAHERTSTRLGFARKGQHLERWRGRPRCWAHKHPEAPWAERGRRRWRWQREWLLTRGQRQRSTLDMARESAGCTRNSGTFQVRETQTRPRGSEEGSLKVACEHRPCLIARARVAEWPCAASIWFLGPCVAPGHMYWPYLRFR